MNVDINIEDKENLKEIAKPFYEYQKDTLLNPFKKIHWRKIQNWHKENKLYIHKSLNYGVVINAISKNKTMKSFGGHKLINCLKGDIQIDALYVKNGYEEDFVDYVEKIIKSLSNEENIPRVISIIDIENENSVSLMNDLGLHYACAKISSFADYKGIYLSSNILYESLSPYEQFGIHKLNLKIKIKDLLKDIEQLPVWANHYSNYNKGASWSALSIRGYSDDISFIEQPSEMSQSWKKKNVEKLEWELRETELFDQLPSLKPILNLITGKKHRIRLMKLESKSGILDRHTDSQSDYHGILNNKVLRLHIPLITNDKVVFSLWDLKGKLQKSKMKEGELWYLDVRKPHKAVNSGSTDRIHLVIDVESNAELLKLF
jgi:hypothetical protein